MATPQHPGYWNFSTALGNLKMSLQVTYSLYLPHCQYLNCASLPIYVHSFGHLKPLLWSQLSDCMRRLVAQLFIRVLTKEATQWLNGVEPEGLFTSAVDAALVHTIRWGSWENDHLILRVKPKREEYLGPTLARSRRSLLHLIFTYKNIK